IVQVVTRLVATITGINVRLLVGGIPDHSGSCTSRYDMWAGVRTISRIVGRYQSPGVLIWVVDPYAIIGYALTGFPTTHEEQHIILTIPGSERFLPPGWPARSNAATRWRYANPTAVGAIHPEIILLQSVNIKSTKYIQAVSICIPYHCLESAWSHGRTGQLLPS